MKMGVDFTRLKKHIETQESLDRYYVLNMTGVKYKEISFYGAYIDVYESDNRYLIKIHSMSNRLVNYKGNTDERYNFCVTECDKYINTHEKLVIKQDNRIIVVNNKAEVILDKIIDDINGVSVIFNTLLIINSVSRTLVCNIHTGDILTTLEPKLGYIASQSKNWTINKSHKLKLFKCKELLLTASIDTRYIGEDIKNFKVFNNVKTVQQTRYNFQSCLYDIKVETDEADYYIRGSRIYTLGELLSLFGITILNKVTDDNNITKYIVQSNSGLIGEMSEDYIQVKFGDVYIKSSVHDDNALGSYVIKLINSRKAC